MTHLNYSVYEIECPHCAEMNYVDYHDMLDEKTFKCPACGKKIKAETVLDSSIVMEEEMPVFCDEELENYLP